MTALTPTETLVLEVLAARHRLGEHVWTFDSRNTPAVRALSGRGLVVEMGGVVEKTVRAALTDAGQRYALSAGYMPPAPRAEQEVPESVYAIQAAGYEPIPFAAARTKAEADQVVAKLDSLVPQSYNDYEAFELPLTTADSLDTIVWWEATAWGPHEVLEPEVTQRAEHQYGSGYEDAKAIPATVEVLDDGLSRPQGGQRCVSIRGRDEGAVRAAVVAVVAKIQEQRADLGWKW